MVENYFAYSVEYAKRYNRYLDAVDKGCFQVTDSRLLRYSGVTVRVFEVWSNHTSKDPKVYKVTFVVSPNGATRATCSCPDWRLHGEFYPCKHIIFCMEQMLYAENEKVITHAFLPHLGVGGGDEN